MRVQVTFETGHPARVEGVEGAVAVVWQDERPLTGLASHADWRLNGFLSRLVMGDKFSGKAGEWLLVHTQGRMPFTHLFLVGMGRRDAHSVRRARSALEGIAGKVALAGLHAFSIDLSEVIGDEMTSEEAMVSFLDALSDSYPEDEFSDPPYLPALEVKERNEERAALHRRRRLEAQEARRLWEGEREADEARRAEAEEARRAEAEEALDDSKVEDGAPPPRPVAGHVPAREVPPPPDPDSLGQPEIEPYPERTVRVVLLGEISRVGELRQALKRMSADEQAPIDVEWSR